MTENVPPQCHRINRARQQQHSFPVAPDETPKTSPALLPFSGRRVQSPESPSLILLPQSPSREVPTHSCAAPPSAGISAAGLRGWQRRCPTSPSWCSHQSPRHPAGKGHWDPRDPSTDPAWITVESRGTTALTWGPASVPTPSQAAVPGSCLTLPRLSLQDESMQALALTCQHQPNLLSTKAPSAPAASDTAQGSHARLSPPLPPPSREPPSTP